MKVRSITAVNGSESGLTHRTSESRRWPIVLAGGQGQRMAQWVEGFNGKGRPKQFCSFTGARTMLRHTLDRAEQISASRDTITVITSGQRRFLEDAIGVGYEGRVVEQPADRGTAAGVLLPAAYVLTVDPEATILVLPSDHFIYPDRQFRRCAEDACLLAERFEDCFVLLGAVPEGPETDYGWILQEQSEGAAALHRLPHGARRVICFQEKPARVEAMGLYRAGGLWNTMVVAVKVKTLWGAARRLLPGMMERFDFLTSALSAFRDGRADEDQESYVLEGVYQGMEPADFSRDILGHVARDSLVLAMNDVEWSDWGRPERVLETMRRLGCVRNRTPIHLQNHFRSLGELP